MATVGGDCQVLTEEEHAGPDGLEQRIRRRVSKLGLDVGKVVLMLERFRFLQVGSAAAQAHSDAGSGECSGVI
jgi:hypothetical protein